MKSILIFFLSLTCSSLLFAANETDTLRTANGQLVTIGDSYTKLIDRMDQSPLSMSSYEWKEGKNSYTAMDYIYQIENTIYTVTVVNNQVKKIEWINKDI
ncbi:hypothetical protein [Acinetobacter silvestris]|uniref:DUF2845 domain-containing protein n=1 Tax=Acinetobacter silvestris TaxID=1977882 RepID=A0A1Y3CET6_9GAMM|nr:hypothetical protein [Acinetobacter silvestris]OTG65597.1 hypothetical protein B9T28_09115 [Acinetobacter silvestris]